MKLIIADDQQSLHIFLDKMMDWSSLGISEVKHAYDGKETVELVEQFDPELLIIDIHMPHLNGIDTLKRLQHLSCNPKTVILSAYDEFEYAREALRLSVAQYLLKPVDTVQLESAMKEMIDVIKQEQTENLKLALASLVENGANDDKWRILAHKSWRTLNMQSCSLLSLSGELPNDEEAELFFSKQAPEAIVVIYPLRTKHYVVLLGWTRVIEQDEAIQLFESAAEQWLAAFVQRKLCIGASQRGENPDKLPSLLEQSKLAAVEAFYGDKLLYCYTGGQLLAEAWTISHYQKFNQAFEEKFAIEFSVANVQALISELFLTFQELMLEPEQVYRLCAYYWDLAVQTMKREHRLPKEYETPSLSRLKLLSTAQELEHYFTEEISKLMTVTDFAAERLEEIVARIKLHVERHYAEELSLQHIAERFELDKYQLSRLFKQQYGINYWQYVTTIRLNKAAELLVGTTLKNSAIAEMTAFVDESHFSKTFKKHYGVSPKEYRAGKRGISM